MSKTIVILDCYTAEPSGLGMPPYLSPYVRDSYAALRVARPQDSIRYVTIDDVRWCLNDGRPFTTPPQTDSRTYSATVNRDSALDLLRTADVVVVIAGEAVPTNHRHIEAGSVEEVLRALAFARGRRVLLGPLVNDLRTHGSALKAVFDARHSHSMTSRTWSLGSLAPVGYDELREDRVRVGFTGLLEQLSWEPIAEIGLYRGCTRRLACSFCSEPMKHGAVSFRDPDDVVNEVEALYAAGARHFRLGQQACFFSYHHRDVAVIEWLLAQVRERCPELQTLHIDNVDPLAAASPAGRRIAALVARFCTEGNCAPLGIDSFDPVVIEKNLLTCPPEVLLTAVATINEFGSGTGPRGMPALLPALNIVLGLPGETHRTHLENLTWLARIVDGGYECLGTNLREATVYPDTALAGLLAAESPRCGPHHPTWRADIEQVFDLPMKARIYPVGRTLHDLQPYFVSAEGSWHRRIGTYPLPVLADGTDRLAPRPAAAVVTGHAPGYVIGRMELEPV